MTGTSVEISSTPRAEWPRDLLDVPALEREGWRSTPFREFVLKVHSRCNLACPYCYVYSMADQTWRGRPAMMSADTVAAAGRRIAEHALTHSLDSVHIVLHGGEPLLAGAARLADTLTTLRDALAPATAPRFAVQTNGVLLDEEMLAVFREHDVRVGVSLDGPVAAHDRNRRTVAGRGTHADVTRALRLLGSDAYRPLFAGLLCVVDLDNDPVAVYEDLLTYGPPTVDFLLPHANWDTPPPGRRAGPNDDAPHAAWLIAVFDRWYAATWRETEIRLFVEIIDLLLGGRSRVETVGLSPAAVLVIETDGAIEQVDALKSAYEGAAALGLSVFEDAFDLALRHPSVVARQIGAAALADTCLGCEVGGICGGGFYPHRYRAGAGFRNPSVYCADLLVLIRHISGRVRADLAGARRPAH
jgi:uncharacterized protein